MVLATQWSDAKGWGELLTLGSMGPFAGWLVEWQDGWFRSNSEASLTWHLLVSWAPAFGPWLLYLGLLRMTRWGRAPGWMHVTLLLLWHAAGILLGLRAAIYYAE